MVSRRVVAAVAHLALLPIVLGQELTEVTLHNYVPDGATWAGPPIFSASTTFAAVGADTAAEETTYVQEVVVSFAAQPYPTKYTDFRDATTTWTLISEPTTATYTFVQGASKIYQSVPADKSRGLLEAGFVQSCSVHENGTAVCELTVLWDVEANSNVVQRPTTYTGTVVPFYTLTVNPDNSSANMVSPPSLLGPLWALCIALGAAIVLLL